MVRGAYIDTKGVTWDTNATDIEGFLSKRSKWLNEWRLRYFLLIGSRMFYGKDEGSVPHGMIDLMECISASAVNETIEIKLKSSSFIILCKSTEESAMWIDAINKSIFNQKTC